MNREDITRMAQDAGFVGMDGDHGALRRFAFITRNATLDEIADKIQAMPFGDTAASFAVWIREQKT